jgi:hypothetical protein
VPIYDYRAAAVITVFSELVLLSAFYVGIRRYLAPVPWIPLLRGPALAGAIMVALGLSLWRLSGPLALLVSLGAYALALFILGAFTPDEIALIMDRRAQSPTTVGVKGS